ncbi:hypothetical protein HDU99_002715 [Rhizoclosmatium hyalinum]|nr:hypothetical protein HDU99_002715 [Rhizoclosmatium hyalinum]
MNVLKDQAEVEKVWFFGGGLIMKLEKEKARAVIEKGMRLLALPLRSDTGVEYEEQVQLDDEIAKLRTTMKEKMNELERLEAELYPNIPGKPSAVNASSFSTLKPANLSELLNNKSNE